MVLNNTFQKSKQKHQESNIRNRSERVISQNDFFLQKKTSINLFFSMGKFAGGLEQQDEEGH